MIVTAREALRLYCHQPRNDKVAYCIADGCMAWRWLHAEGAPFVVTRDPALAQGFCGLAYNVRLPVPVPGNRVRPVQSDQSDQLAPSDHKG